MNTECSRLMGMLAAVHYLVQATESAANSEANHVIDKTDREAAWCADVERAMNNTLPLAQELIAQGWKLDPVKP